VTNVNSLQDYLNGTLGARRYNKRINLRKGLWFFELVSSFFYSFFLFSILGAGNPFCTLYAALYIKKTNEMEEVLIQYKNLLIQKR